jgi:hypothetical protein
MRHARKAVGVLAALCLLGALAVPAQGAHHLVKIRQIHPSNLVSGGEWVELQMPSSNENFVSGTTTIETYNSTPTLQSRWVIGSSGGPHPGSPNGQNQRTILISNLFFPATGVAADYVAPVADLMMTGGDGGVCYTENDPPTYTPIDCVAYGTLINPLPTAGTPGPDTEFEETLERGITRGCATALDSADDTNNSSADFAPSTRAPRNNTMAPNETLCPGPGGPAPPTPAKKCKKKKKKKKGKAVAAAKCKKKKKKKKKK